MDGCYDAARDGNWEEVEKLLEMNHESVVIDSVLIDSVLIFAALQVRTDIMDMCLKRGARDIGGTVMMAMTENRWESVQHLSRKESFASIGTERIMFHLCRCSESIVANWLRLAEEHGLHLDWNDAMRGGVYFQDRSMILRSFSGRGLLQQSCAHVETLQYVR